MSGDDSTSTYAPKSPDLSSFYSGGPTQPASQLHPPSHGPGPSPGQYKLQPPAYSYGSTYAPPNIPPAAVHQPIKSEFSPYSPPAQQHYSPPSLNPNDLSHQSPYGLQQPSFHPAQTVPEPGYPGQIPQSINQFPQGYPQEFPASSPSTSAQASSDMPPRRAAAQAAADPMLEPSPVRTKFPTARIKRIMQADEEVGKVAQQTPIAVGKALEMFMIQLVTKSAEVAKDKGSKRVTAPMLKQVVETDEQWDFLRDIVSRVENEKEGAKSKAKTESESDEDFDEPKKKGRGGGRRKKAQS